MNLLDFIFPKKCLECGIFGKYICDDCLSQVKTLLPAKDVYSVFKYEGVIRKAIMSLKYKFAYDIAEELAEITIQKIKNYDLRIKNIILVPIPLHKLRQNWRGFNQAELIGEKVANGMGWKFVPDFLIRIKNTSQQVGQKRPDRIKNLSDVFRINVPHSLSQSQVSILVFDDVYTTGTTINEAVKVLKAAGFNNIKSLTIARG